MVENGQKLEIITVENKKIKLLQGFGPKDWGTPISDFFSMHIDKPYFYSVIAEDNGNIIGCGCSFRFLNTGWLSKIFVSENFRGLGLGTRITENLINNLVSLKTNSISLISTNSGEHIYRKLGFRNMASYSILRRKRSFFERILNKSARMFGTGSYKVLQNQVKQKSDWDITPKILKADYNDFQSILDLDFQITGEHRGNYLTQYLNDAWVIKEKNEISGFYLKGTEIYPIIAKSIKSGMNLIQFHINFGSDIFIVPTINFQAIDFLKEKYNFNVVGSQSRMIIGNDIDWNPVGIFRQGSSHCG